MTTQKILAPVPKRKTMAEEIAERLVLAIASGEQQPGARVTEALIAEAMDVSRIPAREALLTLAAKGVLESAGARGLRVPDISTKRSGDVLEVRLALEVLAFRKVMKRPRRDGRLSAELDETLAAMAAETSRGANPLALAQLDVEFHRAVVSAADNSVLLRAWEDLAPHLLILFCRDWNAHPNKVGEVALHLDLKAFLDDGDLRQVERVLAQHFTLP